VGVGSAWWIVFRIGLTGGIACGKSQISARLAQNGIPTLDLDHLAHEALLPGTSAFAEVVRAFGPSILDPEGRIDRKALGALVFADPAARSRLNAILHPKIRQQEEAWAAQVAGGPGGLVVTDAALLVESGIHLRFDRLVIAHCDEARQLERLMSRDRIDAAAARARIEAQMPLRDKRRFGHYEVDTSGPREETLASVDELTPRLLAESTALGGPFSLPLERALGCLLLGPTRGPRGLDPGLLTEEIARQGGIEMERVARHLTPPASGPWYEAARSDASPPETLVAPLVLWSLARGAPDPPFLLAAAHSLAWLTHRDGESLASSCLFALALQHVALSGALGPEIVDHLDGWSQSAARWGGAPPRKRLLSAIRAAATHPEDASAARNESLKGGGDPELTGALLGMAHGVPLSEAPTALLDALRRLQTRASSTASPA
jgi:dephospho-CoA kinase